MQCCLIFSAPTLNLIVSLFQPGRSHLLPIRSGNVAVTNLRVKIMGVVSTTKVSNIFPIPLGFQGGPAKEVGVSLQFTREKESSLQWCVI